MASQGKVIFANQLRGVAALLVVLSHLCVVYWTSHTGLSSAFGATPDANIGVPPYNFFVFDHFNFAAFSVAIFFIISGFVIPFSLRGATGARFLIERAFRIFPTYWACLVYSILAIYLSTRYWGTTPTYSARTVLENIFLSHTLTGIPSIDLVNWTLAIEVKFYLLAVILAPAFRAGKVAPIIFASTSIFLICTALKSNPYKELIFLQYMLIGVVFNLHFRGGIGTRALLACTSAFLLLFMVRWDSTYWPSAFWRLAPSYALAFLVFHACYAWRGAFRPVKVLDFLADISYPLYLVHAVAGFGIMRVLTSLGVPAFIAISAALATALIVAYVIHITVEMPSNLLGKSIARTKKQATTSY